MPSTKGNQKSRENQECWGGGRICNWWGDKVWFTGSNKDAKSTGWFICFTGKTGFSVIKCSPNNHGLGRKGWNIKPATPPWIGCQNSGNSWKSKAGSSQGAANKASLVHTWLGMKSGCVPRKSLKAKCPINPDWSEELPRRRGFPSGGNHGFTEQSHSRSSQLRRFSKSHFIEQRLIGKHEPVKCFLWTVDTISMLNQLVAFTLSDRKEINIYITSPISMNPGRKLFLTCQYLIILKNHVPFF